jgi:hypothetical protein
VDRQADPNAQTEGAEGGATMTRLELEMLLLNAGIQIEKRRFCTDRARTVFEDGKFVIHINESWWDKYPEVYHIDVLCHELMHILRGDFLKVGRIKDEKSRGYFNFAADALINQTLPILKQYEPDIWVYERLYHMFGDESWPPPERLPSTQWLERKIRELEKRDTECRGGCCETMRHPPQCEPGDIDAATVEIIAHVVKQLRERFEDDPLARQILQASTDFAAGRGTFQEVLTVEPSWVDTALLERILKRMLHRAAHAEGAKVKRRSYRRRHGIFPISIPMPTSSFILAVDVSGSMHEYYPQLQWLKSRLAREFQAEIWHWSDGAVRVKTLNAAPWFGGTDIRPLLRQIPKRGPGAIVIATDGYIAPPPKADWLPPYPVVWYMITNEKVPVRPGDLILRVRPNARRKTG